ncbi:hypothetical protein M885DRAFT_546252 [Pelagophyceae sp. CCMP2097]|nr:hypothetical protein M885DRAFT_546252 [Pelagophyceae sp. CCMP2097]
MGEVHKVRLRRNKTTLAVRRWTADENGGTADEKRSTIRPTRAFLDATPFTPHN